MGLSFLDLKEFCILVVNVLAQAPEILSLGPEPNGGVGVLHYVRVLVCE